MMPSQVSGAIRAFDPRRDEWHDVELGAGEQIRGTIERLPEMGAFGGNHLYLRVDDDRVVSLPATAKRGHTLLERRLSYLCARAGDEIAIVYLGKRRTADGEREYRDYEVALRPAMEQAA